MQRFAISLECESPPPALAGVRIPNSLLVTQDNTPLDYTLIDNARSLCRLAEEISAAGSVALDTESDSYYHYHQKVCLIQAALPDGRFFIIDPLAFNDLSPLGPVLGSAKILKVLHGAEYDVRCLKAAAGFTFRNIFDTLLARRIVGRSPFGLADLIQEVFGVTISKQNQKGNWSVRPLTPSFLRYALTDVKFLLKLAQMLQQKLDAKGRLDWAEEEMKSLLELPPLKQTADPDAFWRLKGFKKLSERGRTFGREIYLLREKLASKSDLAAFRVLGTDALLGLAAAAAAAKDLSQVRGAATFVERHARALEEAIRRAAGAEPPRKKRSPHAPPAGDKGPVLNALRRVREKLAEKYNLDVGFLCPGTLLEDWARHREKRASLEGLVGWRRELLEGEFLRVVGGTSKRK